MERKSIDLTERAVVAIRSQLSRRGTPNSALRIGIKGGGCSGFSYVLEFSDDPPENRDQCLTFDGIRIYVDNKSMIYLNGITLDWEKTLMWSGFKFVNPNEKSSCGCGHSFNM